MAKAKKAKKSVAHTLKIEKRDDIEKSCFCVVDGDGVIRCSYKTKMGAENAILKTYESIIEEIEAEQRELQAKHDAYVGEYTKLFTGSELY